MRPYWTPAKKDELIDALNAGNIDAVTFTSSSTVSNFMNLLEGMDTDSLLKNVTIASIGPITSDTARNLGIATDIEAESFTIPGLIDALLSFYYKG